MDILMADETSYLKGSQQKGLEKMKIFSQPGMRDAYLVLRELRILDGYDNWNF